MAGAALPCGIRPQPLIVPLGGDTSSPPSFAFSPSGTSEGRSGGFGRTNIIPVQIAFQQLHRAQRPGVRRSSAAFAVQYPNLRALPPELEMRPLNLKLPPRDYSSPQFRRARFNTPCASVRARAAPSASTWLT